MWDKTVENKYAFVESAISLEGLYRFVYSQKMYWRFDDGSEVELTIDDIKSLALSKQRNKHRSPTLSDEPIKWPAPDVVIKVEKHGGSATIGDKPTQNTNDIPSRYDSGNWDIYPDGNGQVRLGPSTQNLVGCPYCAEGVDKCLLHGTKSIGAETIQKTTTTD